MSFVIRLRPALLVALMALILALPSILNGKPFLFYDSTHYFDIGKSIVTQTVDAVRGLTQSDGVDGHLGEQELAGKSALAGESESAGLATISGGRSPIYSVLTYSLTVVFSAYGMVALQSVVAALVIHRLTCLLLPGAGHLSHIGLAAGLALLTPLGFHAGFVMPDIFAGIYVVAALVLILDRNIRLTEALLLVTLLTAAASMHSTIIAIGGVLALLTLSSWYVPGLRLHVNQMAVVWIAVSLLSSAILGEIYKRGTHIFTGDEVRNAPYLLARVIADGTGKRLMDEECDDLAFAVCALRDVSYTDHNDFLWGTDGAGQNFSNSSTATKRAIQNEELDFVRAAVTAYPTQQLRASAQNTIDQFIATGIYETSSGAERIIAVAGFSENEMMRHVPRLSSCTEGRSCNYDNPAREAWAIMVHIVSLICIVVLLLGIARYLPRALSTTATMNAGGKRIIIAGLMVMAVLLVNAAVCGALSGVHDRYQARIAWIAALLVVTSILFWRTAGRHETPA